MDKHNLYQSVPLVPKSDHTFYDINVILQRETHHLQ